MISYQQHEAAKGIAYKLMSGKAIIADYHPSNTEAVMTYSAMGLKYLFATLDARRDQMVAYHGDEQHQGSKQQDEYLMELLHGNDANPFVSLYKPLLSAEIVNWSSAWIGYKSMVNGGLPKDSAQHLLTKAYDLIPISVHLLYSSLQIAETDQQFPLALVTSGTAHVSLRGVFQ